MNAMRCVRNRRKVRTEFRAQRNKLITKLNRCTRPNADKINKHKAAEKKQFPSIALKMYATHSFSTFSRSQCGSGPHFATDLFHCMALIKRNATQMDERETLRYLMGSFAYSLHIVMYAVCDARTLHIGELHVVTTFISVARFWLAHAVLTFRAIVFGKCWDIEELIWEHTPTHTQLIRIVFISWSFGSGYAFVRILFRYDFQCGPFLVIELTSSKKYWLFVWLGYCLLVLCALAFGSRIKGNYGALQTLCLYVDVDNWCDQLYVSIWKIIWQKVVHHKDTSMQSNQRTSASNESTKMCRYIFLRFHFNGSIEL